MIEQETTLTRSQKDSRRDDAIQLMIGLSSRLWDRCHWCNRVIVWWQKLPRRTILNDQAKDGGFKFQAGRVRFKLISRRIHSFHFVTVDHVLELSKGGGNSLDNLVLSCAQCNSGRSNVAQNKYPNCLDCGRLKRTAKKKYCYDCMIDRSRRHLLRQGKIVSLDAPLATIYDHMRGRQKKTIHRQILEG